MRKLFLGTAILAMLSLFSCAREQEKTAGTKEGNESKIKVGIFSGGGSSSYIGLIETTEALKIDGDISPCLVNAAEIMQGKLDKLDVLVFPGGSGSTEFNNLGEKAAEKVKKFLYEDGKGVIGICAGGFILSSTPGYPSLQIFPEADIRDGYYDRGRGLIAFGLNEKGKEIFFEVADKDTLHVQYNDGPIFVNPESGNSTVLGRIYSDVADRPSYPKGTTPGRLVFATSEYGKGRVFVSVGHPESTAGMRWTVPRMARWVSRNELVAYPKNVVRPEINNKEYLFYSKDAKYEKKMFWQLFSEDDSVVISALEELNTLRSRPSIRWSIGLLRHDSPKIRLHAARYLLETGYTDAIDDMGIAMEQETDSELKKELENILAELKAMIGN